MSERERVIERMSNLITKEGSHSVRQSIFDGEPHEMLKQE